MLLDRDRIRPKAVTKHDAKIEQPKENFVTMENKEDNGDDGKIMGFSLARDCKICGQPFILKKVNSKDTICPECKSKGR